MTASVLEKEDLRVTIADVLDVDVEDVTDEANFVNDLGIDSLMAMEVLVPNAAVRNLIREDKIHQIYSAMQAGQDKFGMQTFNQSLATLYFQKQISLDVALLRSSMPDELQDIINRGVVAQKVAAGAATARR